MQNHYVLLLTTCPNRETANHLATYLVQQHLAACVNMLSNLQSIYEWQGEIVQSAEVLLLIKTRQEHYVSIEQALKQHHPYQVPELIAVPIIAGSPAYLAWIDSVVAPKRMA